MNEIQKECIKCQWCCLHANTPIPENKEEWAYLYWVKGRRVYWEPYTKEWYWLAYKPCQYITIEGCSIYEKRPRLCRESFCPFGPKRIKQRYDNLCAAGNRIMQRIHDRGIYA